MMTNKLPGDWTVRGAVIVERSEHVYYGGLPSRVELLRDVARMIQAGQTVVACGMVDGALVVAAEHRGEAYAARRAAAVAALRGVSL